jgi:PEP-CTERM motif
MQQIALPRVRAWDFRVEYKPVFKLNTLALLIAGFVYSAVLPSTARASLVDYTISLNSLAGLSGSGNLEFDTAFLPSNGTGALTPTSGGVSNLQIDVGSSVFNLTQSFAAVAFLMGNPVDIFSMSSSPGVLLTGFDGYLYSAGQEFGAGTFSFSADPVVTAVPEPSTWALIILGFFGVGFLAYGRRRPAFRLT